MAVLLVHLHGKRADSFLHQMRQTKSMSPEYAIRRSTNALLEVKLRQVDVAKTDAAGRPQKLSERRMGE
jgi:hypothetical protein